MRPRYWGFAIGAAGGLFLALSCGGEDASDGGGTGATDGGGAPAAASPDEGAEGPPASEGAEGGAIPEGGEGAATAPDGGTEDPAADGGNAAADAGAPSYDGLKFPDDFVFGAATAGFQVEMGCPSLPPEECNDTRSDWYEYVTSPITQAAGNTYLSGQDPAVVGPGHWELYEQDYDLAKNELHAQGLRLGLEWSRIFPEPTDGVEGYDALRAIANVKALDGYHAMLDALAERGIRPLVTVNHYTLPLWIHDGVGCHQDMDNCAPKGFVDRERTVREIGKFADFVGREFGAQVDWWATVNEPTAEMLWGYVYPNPERTHPPALLLRAKEAKTVMQGLIEAHARIYDGLKAGDTVDQDGDGQSSYVGVVYPVLPVFPKDPDNKLDTKAAKNIFYLVNSVYLNAVIKGEFDAAMDGTTVFREDLANRMDYVGINYYFRAIVTGTKESFSADLSPLATINPLELKTVQDYPRGIYESALLIRDYGLPVIITENGVADPDDNGTTGQFLVEHLQWLHRAMDEGANVLGYFYWTLIDNYEWNHGMDIRMGLFAVDWENPQKTRTARQGVPVFGRMAAQRGIPRDLLEKYPIEAE